MIFCGVFDSHGSLGHKYAQRAREKLPSLLSEAIKMSQQEVHKHHDANAAHTSSNADVYDDKNQNMTFASWEGCFVKSFTEMDEELARSIESDGFSGGCTAITVVK